MLDKELLTKVLKKTISSGGDYAEIFVENKKSTIIHLEDSKIEKVVSGVDYGLGIRLIYDYKSFYAYSNDLSERALLNIASAVSKSITRKTSDSIIKLITKYPSVSFDIEMLPEDLPIEKKISIVRKADAVARGYDDRVRQVSIVYNDSIQKVQIATT
ncbi:MAG: PmbA/TldA family metallopeptidase, partial [Thermodesulfovibrionales bacterium]